MNLPTLQCIVPGSHWARRNIVRPVKVTKLLPGRQGFFCHRLRETPTENKPSAGRSGAPPASLAGICLSEPSRTLIWTEIDYLFYSIVLPNITYGLSVYGASIAEINVLQQFLDRCYKLRFILDHYYKNKIKRSFKKLNSTITTLWRCAYRKKRTI